MANSGGAAGGGNGADPGSGGSRGWDAGAGGEPAKDAVAPAVTKPDGGAPPPPVIASPLAAGSEWASWLGPNGNMTSDAQKGLVDDLAAARLLWTSEERIEPGRVDTISYGASQPVVANGMVYLTIYPPAGTLWDSVAEMKKGVEWAKVNRRILADDVVLAVDAATGKTAWKRVYAEKGYNWTDSKGMINNNTAVVADGRVYAMGSTGRLYAMDAKTGAPLWESHIGSAHTRWEAIKAKALQTRVLEAILRQFFQAMAYADGVLVTTDYNGKNTAVLGFDGAAGGMPIWKVPAALGQRVSPAVWRHQRTSYILAANQLGELRLIEPKTGKERWKLTGLAPMDDNLAFSDDQIYVPIGAAVVGGPPPKLAAYRLSPTGATKLWEAPDALPYPAGAFNTIAYKGHVYLRYPKSIVVIDGRNASVVGRDDTPIKDNKNATEHDTKGFMQIVDGRLLEIMDATHSPMEFFWYDANPKTFRRLVPGAWQPKGGVTCNYGTPYVSPYADGRLFIRGFHHIYAIDLRK